MTKRRLYDRFRVREYWIVDPEIETVRVYRRGETGFVRAGEYSRETGDTFTTPLIEGLTIGLETVFE